MLIRFWQSFINIVIGSGGARGVRGAIAPGRQREGAPKEGGKNFFLMMERVKGGTEA
jgi:hypothetical protein